MVVGGGLHCISFGVDLIHAHMADYGATTRNRRNRQAKNIKTLDDWFRFALGHDIFMDQVTSLCSRALVGRLEYCRLGKKEWIDWASEVWKPLLTYTPTISLLLNG